MTGLRQRFHDANAPALTAARPTIRSVLSWVTRLVFAVGILALITGCGSSSSSSKRSLAPSELLVALAVTPVPRAELPIGLTNPLITETTPKGTAPFHSLGEVTLNFKGKAYIFYTVFPTAEDAILMNQKSEAITARLKNPVERDRPSGFPPISEMYLGRIKNYGLTAVMYVSDNVWVETIAIARGPQNAATKAALDVAHLSVKHLREARQPATP